MKNVFLSALLIIVVLGLILGIAAFSGQPNNPPASGVPFNGAGPAHSPGLVPDPGSTGGLGRFLRDDATWVGLGITSAASCANLNPCANTPITNGRAVSGAIAVSTSPTLVTGLPPYTNLNSFVCVCTFLQNVGTTQCGVGNVSTTSFNIYAANGSYQYICFGY
jgi:hypothetical protein